MLERYLARLVLLLGLTLSGGNLLGNDLAVDERSNFLIIGQDQPERAFLIFPGANLPATAYQDLAQTLVANAPVPTTVLIAKFWGNVAVPPLTGQRVDQALSYLDGLETSGVTPPLFLIGHSQGGILGARAARSKGLAGLVLLAAYLPETVGIGEDFTSYPLPVLTLNAERDGLTGISFSAREYSKMQTFAANDPSARLDRAVIVLAEVNHMQFADGGPLDGDLPAHTSLAEAHRQIAGLIHDFSQVQTTNRQQSAAAKRLQDAIDQSKPLVQPLLTAWADDSQACLRAQKEAANLSPTEWRQINLKENTYTKKTSYPTFIFDKSSLEPQGDRYELTIATYRENVLNLADISLDQWLSPEILGCKLRSQSAIETMTGFRPQGPQPSCAELNFRQIQRALDSLTAGQREHLSTVLNGARFDCGFRTSDLKNGKAGIRLANDYLVIKDEIKNRGDQWALGSFPSLSYQDGRLTMQTFSLNTSTDAIGNFGGAFYCKLYPTSRLVEWMLLFAEKQAMP